MFEPWTLVSAGPTRLFIMLLEGEALLVHCGLEVGLFSTELNRDASVGVDIPEKEYGFISL